MTIYIGEEGYLCFDIDENKCTQQSCLVYHEPKWVIKRYKVNDKGLFEEVTDK